MALFLPLLGQLSGSIAGNTYSHNRAGRYVRARTIPTNPNTTPQVVARAILGSLVNAWKFNSPANKALWAAYAANSPVTNSLGETIYLTGMNWFIAMNSIQAALPTPVITLAAPTAAGQAPAAICTTDVTLQIDVTAISGALATDTVQLQWAGPFPSSINFFKGPFPAANKIVDTLTNVLAANPIVPTALADEVYFTRVRFIDQFRRLSPPSIQRYLVTA